MIGRTFSSLCAYVHALKLPYALHIGTPFNESLGISKTHSNLGFGILLLHRLILLAFTMLILWVVGLTEKTLLVHVIFWIFSCLFVFSQSIFCCTIHHRGRVHS
jgi:hypothetical protein